MIMGNTYFVKMFASIPPTYGGLSVYVKRLTLALNKAGYPSGAYYRFGEIVGFPKDLHVFLDPMIHHARSWMVLPEFPRLYKVCKPYRIIHSHLNFRTVFCMWLIHKLQHKPMVFTVHNQMIDREFEGTNVLDRYCLKSLFGDKIVQFITVNENGKQQLESKYKFANEIKVVGPYLPPVVIGRIEDYLTDELIGFINTHRQFILFYAESFAYNEGKEIYGTDTIIEAFIILKKHFANLALVFCMPNMNDTAHLEKLKEAIREKGFENDVFWQTSGLPEMWPLIKKASLYLRPTSTDGDSVMLREALGLGLQSLASDAASRPKGCVTYRYGDIDDLIQKATNMLHAPKTPKVEAKDNFIEMISIYKKLLNED